MSIGSSLETTIDLVINLFKPKDFIKIEYTGYTSDNKVFDSTRGEVAKKLHGQEGPLLIIFKVDRLPEGLEEIISEMKNGEEREVILQQEKAFGKLKKSLIKVFSHNYFKQHGVKPNAGLNIYLDTSKGRIFGKIKSVSSGRIVVDLNHPMAGKIVKYRIKITDVITDNIEKTNALLNRYQLDGKVQVDANGISLELTKRKNQKEYEIRKFQLLGLLKIAVPEITVNIKEST